MAAMIVMTITEFNVSYGNLIINYVFFGSFQKHFSC